MGNSVGYRYGFNGMETDPEVKEGWGQHFTTYFRQYDPRLGRWWSNDPVVQIGESPYAAMFNNPIGFSDPIGNDPPEGENPLDPQPRQYPTTGGESVYVPSEFPTSRSDVLRYWPGQIGAGSPTAEVPTNYVLPAGTPTEIREWMPTYNPESGTLGGYWKSYTIQFRVTGGPLGKWEATGYYAADGSRYHDILYRPVPWYVNRRIWRNGDGADDVFTLGLHNVRLPTVGLWEYKPFHINRPFDIPGTYLINAVNTGWNKVAGLWNGAMNGTLPSGNDMFLAVEQTSWDDIGNALTDVRTYESLPSDLTLIWLTRKAPAAETSGAVSVGARSSNWVYGGFKTEAKWASQLSNRGWTPEQITEAISKGQSFSAINSVNKANTATRYVHPTTGQSVVIDDVTRELLHVGGPGFNY